MWSTSVAGVSAVYISLKPVSFPVTQIDTWASPFHSCKRHHKNGPVTQSLYRFFACQHVSASVTKLHLSIKRHTSAFKKGTANDINLTETASSMEGETVWMKWRPYFTSLSFIHTDGTTLIWGVESGETVALASRVTFFMHNDKQQQTLLQHINNSKSLYFYAAYDVIFSSEDIKFSSRTPHLQMLLFRVVWASC